MLASGAELTYFILYNLDTPVPTIPGVRYSVCGRRELRPLP